MKPSRETLVTSLLLLALIAAGAVGLAPELSISRVDRNENVFHFAMVERMVQAVERGENPLDCWSPEWSFGYPVTRLSPPLAPGLVAAVYFALGKAVDLMTVFVWVRFLALVLLPLNFFAAARLMGLGRWTALAAALLAPLVSTNSLSGIDYGSFTWAGGGLFPQLVATHFLLLALGFGCRAVRRGRGLTVAGALVGLTFLSSMIYGYMGAASCCLMAAVPDGETRPAVRARRVVWIGAAALAAVAFQLLPLLRDSANINHSGWDPAWKWDSYGAGPVLGWLGSGKLLDYGRLPVLTLLAAAGAARLYWKRDWVGWFAALGAGFWVLMYFGRPFWGPALVVLGVGQDARLYQFIGGAHIFLVLLAGIALAEIWGAIALRWHAAAAVAATALLLFPMVRERAAYLAGNATQGEANLAAYRAAKPSLDAALAAAEERGGRVYAGLPIGWGAAFKVGDVPVDGILSTAQVPGVGFPYDSMALPGDLMARFDAANPAEYRLFNIGSVMAPSAALGAQRFLVPRQRIGQFQLFDAPGGGYFDLVDVPASALASNFNFFEVNDRWLSSGWVSKRYHLWLDWHGNAPPELLRALFDEPLPNIQPAPPAGVVRSERRTGEMYQAEFDAARNCFALFKMTWHRNWKASLDGVPVSTAMLSPGFVGVLVSAGHHRLAMRYEAGNGKLAAALAGVLLLVLLGVAERRGWRARWEQMHLALHVRREWLVAGGIALLALPVSIPLVTNKVLYGHDAMCYYTRLAEVQQNLAGGIVVPRWAPDFASGAGQPLFVFHPPLFYWLAELCHLAGFGFTAAVNAATILLVVASAAGIFLLARLYFGEAGGWLAAAAYLYAPYFSVDLFVRCALEEFTSFPFMALALYGFGAYAKGGKRRHWLLGVAAYAAVIFCSFPAALLFSPLLAAFVAFTAWRAASWKVWWKQVAGVAFGLALAVTVWLPAMVERPFVWMERVLGGGMRYSNHLVDWYQLFYSPWGYGQSVPGPHDGLSLALGWSHVLLAAVACIWIEKRWKPADRWMPRFLAAAAVVICLVMLQPMEWLWDRVLLLQFVELPWRLLGAAGLCLAMLAGALGATLAGLGRWRKPAMAAALALLIVPNLSHLHPRAYREIDPAFWTPRLMAVRGFESTAQAEVTPRWVNVRAKFDPDAAHVTGGVAEIRQTGRTPFSWSADVTAASAATVRLSTTYYPGWEVSLDGHPAEIGPSAENGLIQFQVPPGEHRAEAVWNGTAVERWSDVASLVALGVWLAAFLFRREATQPAIGPAPPTPPTLPIEDPRRGRRKPGARPRGRRRFRTAFSDLPTIPTS